MINSVFVRAGAAVLPLALGYASGGICPVSSVRGLTYVPPGWIFGLMWTVIYVCLGALIYTLPTEAILSPWVLAALGVNLLFNWTWTPMYAKSCFDRPDIALFWILACKVSLFALAVAIVCIAPPFFLLYLAVYWAWLDVALVLNWASISASAGKATATAVSAATAAAGKAATLTK